MAELDWKLRRADDVTLVELLVKSDEDEYVRIESRLEPVWPPRRQGRPVAGWDETGFECTVESGERLALGYASPAEAAEPPAELTTRRPATDTKQADCDVTARELVRTLGEAAPPRDALPDPKATPGRDDREITPSSNSTGNEGGSAARNATSTSSTDADGFGADAVTVETCLDAIERRLEAAEPLATASTVEQARAAVDEVGGLATVRQLRAQIVADRHRVDRLTTRGRSLEERLDAVEVPVETLERVV